MDKRTIRKKHARHEQKTNDGMNGLFKGCICGLLISLSAAIATLSITSAYALTKPDPESVLLPIASFLAYPCAILGGFVSCRVYKESTLLCSLIYGLMTIVLSIAAYPLLPLTGHHPENALSFFLLRGILLLCCVCGCLLGSKILTGDKKRRHRRR